MPTMRGKNHDEHASGTIPRRVNTKPIFAELEIRRISIANVMVAPIPTAGPLIAPMIGLLHLNIRNVTVPPPSRRNFDCESVLSEPSLKVPPPPDKSAPAQNPRPEPVITTARTLSSASISSNTMCNSRIMVLVNALSFSGRCNVTVATPSATEYKSSV